MKRIWKTLLAVLVITLALTACGTGNDGGSGAVTIDPKADFIGTWEIVKMVEEGEETPTENLQLMKDLGLNVYLELNEDDTASLELFDEAMSGTWEATEADKGSITIEGQAVPMVIDDGLLTMEQEGSVLVFKQIDPSEKMPAANVTDLFGDEGEGITAEYFGGDTIDDLDDPEVIEVPVVNNDDYAISIIAKGSYVGDPAFLFEIENKTDADILVMSLEGWTVDGVERDTTLYETVKAGEKLDSIMWFGADEVGDDVSALTNIAGQIGIFSADETADLLDSFDVAI